MNPDPPKLFWTEARVHLVVKEVGHRLIIEGHMSQRAGLLHQLQVLYQQQIVLSSNPEASDFGVSIITQVQQFRPGSRAEPQLR